MLGLKGSFRDPHSQWRRDTRREDFMRDSMQGRFQAVVEQTLLAWDLLRRVVTRAIVNDRLEIRNRRIGRTI